MFKHLFRKRGSATERGFTVLEIAVAIGIVLLLSVAGILGYGKIQRNAEIAAVEQAAGQAYTAAMSGAFTAAQIEADASNDDITVRVYNLSSPYLLGASGASGGLRSMSASRIMPAAVEHQEPCVVAEGYDYRATRGACEDFVDGTEPGGEDGSGEEECTENRNRSFDESNADDAVNGNASAAANSGDDDYNADSASMGGADPCAGSEPGGEDEGDPEDCASGGLCEAYFNAVIVLDSESFGEDFWADGEMGYYNSRGTRLNDSSSTGENSLGADPFGSEWSWTDTEHKVDAGDPYTLSFSMEGQTWTISVDSFEENWRDLDSSSTNIDADAGVYKLYADGTWEKISSSSFAYWDSL